MVKKIKRNIYLITFILILVITVLFIIRHKRLKEENIEYQITKLDPIIEDNITLEEETKESEKVITKVKVDIKGQVVTPGVYELEDSSRVIDVVNLAGGFTENANTSLINLSKKVKDGMVIIIYSNEEVLNSNVKEVETVFKIIEKECNCPNIKNDSCINTELDKEDATDKETVDKEITDNDKNEEVNDNNDKQTEDNKLININTATLEELQTLSGIGESKAKAIIEYREKNSFNTIEDIKNVSGIGEAAFNKIKEFICV